MKSILIVSSDPMENERMRAALSVQGWWVTVVTDRQSSMRAAADQAPDLALVESGLLGAGELVATFASVSGGPGLILLGATDQTWAEDADEQLPTPVDTQRLVLTVRRLLETPRLVPAGGPAAAEQRLTAAEIFAEVLHEVEYGGGEPAAPAELLTVPAEIAETSKAAARVAEPATAARRPTTAPSAGAETPAAPSPATDEGALRFGQFQLEERIAVGGMAEVWKARMTGVEGFEKTVAIKKILPHLSESGDFEKMFIEEAKLAADLNHDNIVRINDLGRIEDSYFIAMEYVEGKDLRRILTAARKRGERLPLGLSVLIGTRLASALDYAHRHVVAGSAEGIVHRDVSPRNVLVGYGGGVKLCDFGIAKASSRVSSTRTGAIKGKLQFMSPEQAWGRPVDGRSDVFSLGIVLFEMLTGERLFRGDNEISLLDAVRGCMVRSPRQVDPALPEELEEVVMRALKASPADRYESAGEMQRDLEKILYALEPTPGSEDLAAYVERLFDSGPAAPEAPLGGAPEAVFASPSRVPAAAPAAGVETPPLPPEPPVTDDAPSAAAPPAPPEPEPVPAQEATAAVADAEQEAVSEEQEATTVDDAAFVALGDGVRRKRLVGAIAVGVLVVALALALYVVLRSGSAVPDAQPATTGAPLPTVAPETAPEAGDEAAAVDPAAIDPATAEPTAAPDSAAAASTQPAVAPLEDLVNREMARREAELRQRFENEQERVLQEFEELQPAAGDEPPPAADASAGDDGDGGDDGDDGGETE